MPDEKIDMEEWRKGPLYRLLFNRLKWLRSKTKRKLLDVHKVAEAIEYSHEAVYKWLRSGKISTKGATAIVNASRKKLANRDLYPFLLS